jgi:RNA polymerase sigma factor (sigma-70 family)
MNVKKGLRPLFFVKSLHRCNLFPAKAYYCKSLPSNLIIRLLMTEKEYNQCVNQYADNVYRFILKNLRHEEDARDVVQSAFEKMWVNRAEVDAARCKSYLFTVAYHQMIDHIRKVKRIQLKDEFREDSRITDRPVSNTRKILETALSRLSETQRSLVLLKDYEGYSYEEIGKITGLSESQVKVYLHRARIQLKNFLVSPENVM